MSEEPLRSAHGSEGLADGTRQHEFLLRLYVSGATPRSGRALASVKRVCEERLAGRYQLEVIDLAQQPELAAAEKVVAVPTLIRQQPLPMRRLSGDLSRAGRILALLELQPETPAENSGKEELHQS